MSFINSSLARSAQGRSILSNDDLVRIVPGAFATAAHESRSEKFRPIPTMVMIDRLRAEGFVPVSAAQSRTRDASRRGFTRHLIRLRRVQDMERPAAARRVGDTFAEALLENANDGSSSYKLHRGLFRLICLNGMVTELPGGDEVRVGHRGNQEDVIRKVIEGTFTVLRDADATLDTAERWEGTRITQDHAMLLAQTAHEIRFGENATTPIQPRQLIAPRRSEDTAPNLWNTFNVVQENVMRGGLHGVARTPSGRTRNVTTREINGIDEQVGVNKALWKMAANFERLMNGQPLAFA